MAEEQAEEDVSNTDVRDLKKIYIATFGRRE